jgi:hypothetical protein
MGRMRRASDLMARRETHRESLFVREDEVALRLGQTPSEWSAKAIVLERHGLPPVDPLMGGRYWPAVVAFFDGRYGISKVEARQPDGGENLDALR